MAVEQLPPRHPISAWLETVESGLTDALATDPMWLPAPTREELLVEVTVLTDRIEALRLRLLAAATDLAHDHGHRNVAAFLAAATTTDYAPNHHDELFAQALARRWTCLAAALADGRVNRAQAKAIAAGLDALVADGVVARHDRHLIHKAEKQLIDYAATFAPRQLRQLAEKILEVVAPDHYDSIERDRLAAADRRAAAATRLTLRNRRDGTVDLRARIPEPVAARLKKYLDAHTSPRHQASPAGTGLGSGADPATGIRMARDRILGEAFCTLLENLDATRLPLHGGNATTVVVTIDLDELVRENGIGTLLDGTPITAGQVRRLACQAGIIPAVLDGDSHVLDLGRTNRYYNHPQRLALALQHPTCRAEGCTTPADWCEAHHTKPWATGGPTDLDHGVLLCPWHHHRIHDTTYDTTHLPNGDIRFHRRR